MPHDEIDGDLGISRRQLIKRGAVVGGTVLWAAPVVQSLTTPALGATLYGAKCPNCTTAAATGLRALGLTFGTASGSECRCAVNVNANAGTLAGASAQVACGKADNATCTASSYLAGLAVNLGSASNGSTAFLEATALSSCVGGGTGASQIARLELVLRNVLGTEQGRALITVTAGCNTGIDLSDALASLGVTLLNPVAILFNEQVCDDGTLTVNALRVTVAGLNVVAGQSRAGGSGCVCTPCSPNPACTPPTSRLC